MNNYWKHFKIIMKHKYFVFMEMKKYGLYWRGLMHDMSKFHPAEFRVARYYTGTGSPINNERKQTGYSHSWLHHFHNNKHHWEFWYDVSAKRLSPIPEKYLIEMVCDVIGAAKAYNGKNYTPEMPIEYIKNCKNRPEEHKAVILPMLYKHLGIKERA